MWLWALFPILLLPAASLAIDHPESYYADQWCSERQGQQEYTLPDRTPGLIA